MKTLNLSNTTQGPEISYGKVYEIYIGEDCALSKHAHLIHESYSNFQVFYNSDFEQNTTTVEFRTIYFYNLHHIVPGHPRERERRVVDHGTDGGVQHEGHEGQAGTQPLICRCYD